MAAKNNNDLTYVYQISIVERMTGLTRRRIRYYEEAGLVTPRRTPGGHRLYSPQNVDMLRRIKRLMDSGITTLESVRRMIAADLDGPVSPQPVAGGPKPMPIDPRWPPRDLGDAAVRVMRPVEPRVGTIFGRTGAVPKNDRDKNET